MFLFLRIVKQTVIIILKILSNEVLLIGALCEQLSSLPSRKLSNSIHKAKLSARENSGGFFMKALLFQP
jgi:hypothetical protein